MKTISYRALVAAMLVATGHTSTERAMRGLDNPRTIALSDVARRADDAREAAIGFAEKIAADCTEYVRRGGTSWHTEALSASLLADLAAQHAQCKAFTEALGCMWFGMFGMSLSGPVDVVRAQLDVVPAPRSQVYDAAFIERVAGVLRLAEAMAAEDRAIKAARHAQLDAHELLQRRERDEAKAAKATTTRAARKQRALGKVQA